MPITITHTTKQVSDFLEIVIARKLKAEIDTYVKAMKQHGNSWEIITYNEIAMLSLFKSALLRGEKPKEAWAMQEYEVFDKHKRPRGRADLFATVRKPELTCDLLIEAKWDGTYTSAKKDNDINYWHHSLTEALKQGNEYYEYEKDYFIVNSFLVTMFFGNYKAEDEAKYKEYRVPKADSQLENESYQFFVHPENAPNTLCVYGQILKVK